ncbi:putative mitochondrial zinc finger protein family member, putative (ZC3H34) [Leptomonas pyrrhocoris]|uniref:Putative mitochondrial zinc finger protein family member, putative (ZC3H34) n=1 Tax=Leptomonas pyrrhocoris TaxID=157538 RepID=A0A0M9FQM6_LEPPY|nr:putative mitochondrial zinc finger protein family member, putative (ZC3H34) [Leptomonas pyrrhocoris]XP_015652453.1 putative mitochondrial zinc finger protein family member, putative (ZC3H34) [Leptomonas pyrrhocoris]KPA74013.1 putative mitochondrial zinc finger protein family member, putative (ZC3H34) [Leptomonas pyrrhocoris]KPA74014.1 putative mitochondrial zinc finger protein family member, putative (ZC3H34) [Leptomonas pyrrhocoris]|eukprot:XP_015652452.1 putative mitochondrial zinc finger protein family member, putative (ZC3H34) [Leptomonas pyrrhocoris]
MQRPQYETQGPTQQYNRPAYNNGGYNMNRLVDDAQQQGYNQPPANYYQQPQGYPMGNPMYNAPQGYPPMMPGYRGGRGRGWYYPNGGRGGFSNMRGGFRGGRGGYPIRRKKPFVGGTLETQREWEQQTACCFYLQGNCKFGDACRFLHEDGEGHPCQFGDKCRVHGTAKAAEGEQPAADSEAKKDAKVVAEKAEKTEKEAAPAKEEEKKE